MKPLNKKSRIISYLEFKLNKELAYEDTFGKEEKIQEEYKKYLEEQIPLCPRHHNMGNESIHLNKRLFEEKFGTEKQLLIKTNIKLNQLERSYLFYEK